MGEVYRATDSHLKRSVAIKVLPAAMSADADRLMRFQREAEVLAALDHPNIAAIYGIEKTPDRTAHVMELVAEKDLSEVIAARAVPLADAYVRSLVGGGRVQVSDAGGRLPVWSHDSRRLFYQTPGGTISVTLDLGVEIRVSRVPLATMPSTDTLADAVNR
jgi:hypothetical protein